MDLNNIILYFILTSFGLFFYKYLFFILNKYNLKFLVDNELTKPQAFHQSPIPTIGGLGIFFSFLKISRLIYGPKNDKKSLAWFRDYPLILVTEPRYG